MELEKVRCEMFDKKLYIDEDFEDLIRIKNFFFCRGIELSLKELKFTESQTTSINQENRSNCNFIQRDEVENHGLTQGIDYSLGGNDGFDGDGKYFFKASVSYDQAI